MNPTPEQLTYIAAMLFQLRIELSAALRLARISAEVDSLWVLQPRDALCLVHALEHEKWRRGFPQLHLN